jgi:16S rRNA (guanine527-N7)-methyltransferase
MSGVTPGERLNTFLAGAGMSAIDPEKARKFETYLSLILRWSARLNLTSLKSEDAIIAKHLCESIACSSALPSGLVNLLDFGSGAGLPGIPIAICRPEIAVTLAESQGKKAGFLQEAVRALGLSAKVYGGRAETLDATFDCVTLRAVDKMPRAVQAATKLVAPRGWLALMTTTADLANLEEAAGREFSWIRQARLPGTKNSIVALGRRQTEESRESE